MHPVFSVSAADIVQLNDENARELVARLCKAELRKRGVDTSPVTWGGDQRAKDGGVDVRIDISSAISLSGYIPREKTAFQVKAEIFTPAKIPSEMAPKGILRPAIEELNSFSGAYIIVSTKDSCSDTSLINRKKAMSGCLEKYGLAGKMHLDFYDSRRVADWVSGHPCVLVWLRSILGRSIQGWKPYGPWAYKEKSVEDEYLFDEKVKVFIPNNDEAITALETITRLREELTCKGTSVRVIGLSGVGKTRLVQSLFDSRITTPVQVLSSDNVIYTDLSDNPSPQPLAMLEALILEKADGVLIIDNCGQESHRRLTEELRHSDSKLCLVTIEYDIRDDLPDETSCYRLEGSSDEVIAKLLRRYYKSLSELDIEKIVIFSDGNARVAFALASTSTARGQLSLLRDDDLFKRLFIQKNTESQELQRCAEAASLLYSFDAEDVSATSELAILSSICEVSITNFLRNVAELMSRGLIQTRGKWRAVLPHAIANRLAIKCIENYLPSEAIKLLGSESSERVSRSFSRRLGFLHESKKAKLITGEWLQLGGILSDLSKLSDFRRQMFWNIAPINERIVLDVLLRAIEDEGFLSINNPHRSEYTRLLRSLAYEPNLFDDAVTALLQFGMAEPEDYNNNPTRKVLQSLFYSQLSGTLASQEQRANFIKVLINSGERCKQKVALLLIQASLVTDHFSSHYGFDFGALRRTYGWYPNCIESYRSWYKLFIEVCVEFGQMDSQEGLDSRSILGQSFSGLWGDEVINDVLINASRKLFLVDGWPSGWIAVRNTLKLWEKNLDEKSLMNLQLLERELAPRDLWAKINAKILSRSAFASHIIDDDEDVEQLTTIQRQQILENEIVSLGRSAAVDSSVLSDLKPYLFNPERTNKLWFFGVGVGQVSASTNFIFDQVRHIIEISDNTALDIIFVCGLLEGWSSVKPEEAAAFFDFAITDKVWAAHFPTLQLSVKLDRLGYDRIIKSIEFGVSPSRMYYQLGWGRRTDALSVIQIFNILDQLSLKKDNGLEVAVDILHMVIHCKDNKSAAYDAELKEYTSKFISRLNWSQLNLGNMVFINHLEEVVGFAVSDGDKYKITTTTLARLVDNEQSGGYFRKLGELLKPFFREAPLEALNVFYKNNDEQVLRRLVAIEMDRHQETVLSVLPTKFLIDWCAVSPEHRCIFAAKGCKLFEWAEPTNIDNEKVLSVSDVAKSILRASPNKNEVLDIFINRFLPLTWSGSRAAILRMRVSLLETFNPDGDVELASIIKLGKDRLSMIITQEEQWEQEHERISNSSFE